MQKWGIDMKPSQTYYIMVFFKVAYISQIKISKYYLIHYLAK